jgi:hypothetical protein
MTDQLTLDTFARQHTTVMPGLRVGRLLTLQERFEEWLASPDGQFVAEWIRERALQMRHRGWRHYSVKALYEAARFARDVQVGPNAGWKLNNSYTSRLARLLMQQEPELESFFEVRELRAG